MFRGWTKGWEMKEAPKKIHFKDISIGQAILNDIYIYGSSTKLELLHINMLFISL
jgi:hypothetical protein